MKNRYRIEVCVEGDAEGTPPRIHFKDTLIEAETLKQQIVDHADQATAGNVGVDVKIIDTAQHDVGICAPPDRVQAARDEAAVDALGDGDLHYPGQVWWGAVDLEQDQPVDDNEH